MSLPAAQVLLVEDDPQQPKLLAELLQASNVSVLHAPAAADALRMMRDTLVDLVLLDGPHAYPLPQIEFAYLFPRIRTGGWLALDDIQIPSVYELFRFLGYSAHKHS